MLISSDYTTYRFAQYSQPSRWSNKDEQSMFHGVIDPSKRKTRLWLIKYSPSILVSRLLIRNMHLGLL